MGHGWELCRLHDGKWSVRANGKEVYILPAMSINIAQAVEKMLNTIPVVECLE